MGHKCFNCFTSSASTGIKRFCTNPLQVRTLHMMAKHPSHPCLGLAWPLKPLIVIIETSGTRHFARIQKTTTPDGDLICTLPTSSVFHRNCQLRHSSTTT
ncbi:hypothetical protein GOODEAATRI_015023 [Goodea atripinnis]|uniref:Uncharacterized protein n=1 Tax=Goodea atripinnis TaxID=208336 RepID=A0ABV0PYM7_9TELE